jgi:hypothetical protein
MIVGSPDSILATLAEEEKKAKDNIARFYSGKEKEYAVFIEDKKKQKKAVVKDYYSTIARNAEGYLKREHDYVRLYEDYKVLISAFDQAWEKAEKEIAAHPERYVKFAVDRFQEMMGKPDRAIASAEFRPYMKYKVPTEESQGKLELKIFKGKAYADFSPSFVKELIMPLYADKAMGEG